MSIILPFEDIDVSFVITDRASQEIHINLNSTLTDLQSLISEQLVPKLKDYIFARPNISMSIAGLNFDNRKVCTYTNIADFALILSNTAHEVLDQYFASIPETKDKNFIILQHLHRVYYDVVTLAHHFTFIDKNRNIICNTEGFFYALSFRTKLRIYFRLSFVLNCIKTMLLNKIHFYNQLVNIQYNQLYINRNFRETGNITVKLTPDELTQFIDSTKHVVAADLADYTTAINSFFLGHEGPIGKISFRCKKNVVADIFYQLYSNDQFPDGMSKEACKAWVRERFEVMGKNPDLKNALEDAFKSLARPHRLNKIALPFIHQDRVRSKKK